MNAQQTRGFDLIIFDCDGVLVDSERVANQVFAQILKEECQLELSLVDMFDTFVGCSQAKCLEIIEQLTGKPAPEILAERYQQEINQALFDTVEAVKDIESVLQQLETPYCVASSGSHEKMQLTLGKTGLLKYFDNRIFSVSEVARGKPFPDIFLHAAKTMSVKNSHRCLVIEDSPPGVCGGISAGMTVFGYSELMPAEKLLTAGAHKTFDEMNLLPTLIATATALI